MLFSFIFCAYLATYTYVEKTFSKVPVLALALCFIFGIAAVATVRVGSLRRQNRKLSAAKRERIAAVNFIAVLVISGTAGYALGGLLEFQQINYLAFSVLLFFLGIRMGNLMYFFF